MASTGFTLDIGFGAAWYCCWSKGGVTGLWLPAADCSVVGSMAVNRQASCILVLRLVLFPSKIKKYDCKEVEA